MGIVRMGPPENVVLEIAGHFGINTFVETGTFKATTAVWASKHFKKVFTVEAAETIYREAVAKHGNIGHLHFIHGHSTAVLAELVADFESNHEQVIFWLDAHWSGGETYGEQDECPLLDELKVILQSNTKHIILIDDARLFLAPPPCPHDAEAWPLIGDVVESLSVYGHKVLVLDDVIFCFPAEDGGFFRTLFQGITTRDASKQRGGLIASVIRKLKNMLASKR